MLCLQGFYNSSFEIHLEKCTI
uniref:Uncharacterized protein n=1 Tax=Arundo donax TaxID=35708 RepID=A0A0A9EGE8_ARUDO